MTHTWTLSMNRMRLALRNRIFIFFSLVMPLGFLFFYALVFGRENPHVLGGTHAPMTYLLGAVLGLTVMGSFWGLSVQLVMWREQGILRRFRLAPVSAGAMISSSIISNYFLTLPTVIIEFVIARGVFKMNSWGNLWGVFLLVTAGTATFAALGLIVASVTNTMQETQVINNVIWFAFLFLSGATMPLFFLPDWVQRAALFLPATFLVSGLEGAMLGTASTSEIAGDFFVLAAGLLVAFEISRQLFRWEPDAKVPGRAKAWIIVALIPFFLLGAWENVYGHRLKQIRAEYQSIEQRSTPSPIK